MISLLKNAPTYPPLSPPFTSAVFQEVRHFHSSLPQYAPTPLVSLPALAKELGVKSIYVKDESHRFGLNAFKGLGASYAISKIKSQHPKDTPLTVVTATDGNHGKAVAWAAKQAGGNAFVFMPAGTLPCRVEAIRAIGNAVVEVTPYNYSETVQHARDFAQKHAYYLVQDTGFADYKEIPDNITAGYSTMVWEALTQMPPEDLSALSHVFLQAGVGSMAAGVIAYLAQSLPQKFPQITILEATDSACIYQSIEQKRLVSIGGNPHTIMAGLNCGDVNPHIMPLLSGYSHFFATCSDEVTKLGMCRLGRPLSGDPSVVSGESGAVGVGFLMAVCADGAYQDFHMQMGLHSESVVLLFSTEGDTDPENYQRVLAETQA